MNDCLCCGIHTYSGLYCGPCGQADIDGDDSCYENPDTWHCPEGMCDGSDCSCVTEMEEEQK